MVLAQVAHALQRYITSESVMPERLLYVSSQPTLKWSITALRTQLRIGPRGRLLFNHPLSTSAQNLDT
jgi:hypothetical protein